MNKEYINDLIKENEYLVYKLASKYSYYYSMEDLYQAGMIGVIKASKKYDQNSDSKFSSYAYKYILGEIVDFIKKDRNITISDEVFSLYKKYLHIKDLLFDKYEREATLKEICDFMNIKEEYLIRVIESVSFTKRIDNDNVCYEDNTEKVIDKILIDEEVNRLSDEDKLLIDYRYYKGYTQSETADIMGISQVKVSRSEKLILSKLKRNIC